MTITRALRHSCTGHWQVRRHFPASVLAAIARAVQACERQHPGEIRVVIEAALHPLAAWRGVTPHQRAIEVFAQQRVWDTEHNNGVLIYFLLADRAVEIVADRFVARGRVPQAEWDAACRAIEAQFRERRFETGVIVGVEAVAAILARYPPGPTDVGNELPDAPLILA